MRLFGIVLLLGVGTDAWAYKQEFGFSFEPSLIIHPTTTESSPATGVAVSPGAGFSLEYHPIDYLVVVARGAYAIPVMDSTLGDATFSNRSGAYFFRQHSVLFSAGLRLESPPSWLPVTLSITAAGGGAVFIQSERDLRDSRGVSYKVPLETIVRPVAAANFGVGISARVHHQIRLGLEPMLHLFFIGRGAPVLGFSAHLGLTFLFFI